jgi:hypothetical protein
VEGRRRRQLTPLSGELRTPEWTPPEPVKERRWKRKEKPAPTTRAGVVLHGLLRFALIFAGIAGATALIALLVVWSSNASATHVFPRAFYFAGAGTAAVAFLGGTGTYNRWYRTRSEHEVMVSRSFVYGVLAVLLIGIGVALEIFL